MLTEERLNALGKIADIAADAYARANEDPPTMGVMVASTRIKAMHAELDPITVSALIDMARKGRESCR